MKTFLGRDIKPLPVDIAKSEESFIFDKNGKRYIDFSTNWCGILGWDLPVVKSTIKNFNGPTYIDPNFGYQVWEELAKLLVEIAPGKMAKAFRATGGTESVEIAMQAAMNFTKRTKFVSTGGYHGHSFAALSLGFDHYRERYPNLLPCEKINPPYDQNSALKIEGLLAKKDVAAYISEPIMCNQGVIIPNKEYFAVVQNACKKYGTVFIIDEVATGFCRTGKMFASEYFDLTPDIICLGKGLTGGTAALGATLMNAKLAKTMEYEFSYYSTFGWQPLNAVITLNYLKYLRRNQSAILEKVNFLVNFFGQTLNTFPKSVIKDYRIKGCAMAIEFHKATAQKTRDRCLANGLIVENLNPYVITFFPSANMSLKVAEEGLKIFKSSIKTL